MSTFETKFSTDNPFRIDMRRVADVALRSIKDRTARAVNSLDQQAKPLNAAYARAKVRAGAQPIRDLRFTGETMNALRVTQVTETGFTIGFTDATAELRAKRDEREEVMLKLSPRDKQEIKRAMQDSIGGK